MSASSRLPRLLVLATAALTALSHLRFLVLDTRLPRDLCLCLGDIPATAGRLASPRGWLDTLASLAEPSGWLVLLDAVTFDLGGPNAVQLLDVVGITAVVLLSARLGTTLGGPWAGSAAALLVAAMPGLVVEGRLGWIHLPEAAMTLGALAAWAADPVVSRVRTAAMLGILGAAILTLRPSGLVWTSTLLLPLAWSWYFGGGDRRHLGVVLGAWAVAALVPFGELPDYLAGKLMARARYASVVPALLPQLALVLGALPLGVLGLSLPGVGLGLRRVPTGAARVLLVVIAAWAGGAAALVLLFRAGLDNHVTAMPAFAILAGWGFATMAPRAGSILAGLAFLAQLVPQWLPTPGAESPWWRIPGAWRYPVAPTILNYYVPFEAYEPADVTMLVDAVCPGTRRCTIVTTDGLYLPHGEEPGQLELFYAGEDRVDVVSAHALPADRMPKVDALVEYICREPDRAWESRWPQNRPNRDRLVREQKLTPVWATEVAPGCRMQWSVPEGRVPEEGLPPMR